MAPTSRRQAPRSNVRRKSKKGSSDQKPKFDLPYFAHQQLDPQRYTLNVGLPVGKPGWAPAPKEIASATNGGWDGDVDAPMEEDPDARSDIQSPLSQEGRRYQSILGPHNPYKRLKVEGGRPAVSKKVTADLDSDDELIVRMKNAKYLEKHIADRLKSEGRTNYHPKTIGTRWARIRKVLEQRNDDLLDAELTDWHEGDDDVLTQAVSKADEIVAKAKADAEARKWKIVADVMKNLKPVVNFSQNACRSRYEDLQAGTARPTPESVLDPDEATKSRIKSRREKERLIHNDKVILDINSISQDNIEGNGWTSKHRKYF